MKVHIVGGGPAGLYFAILMKKAWPRTRITVFERNRPDDTFGFGVVFSDQTLEAFEAYDRETYRQIVGHFSYWDDIAIHFRGTVHRIGGNGFCGTSRTMLLKILGRRAHSLGIDIKYQSEADPMKPTIRGADLVVAADGINSRTREGLKDKFNPTVEMRPNHFVWMGSTKPLDAFNFYFRETEHGIFIAHCYQYQPGRSTWIFETDPETFQRAGLGSLDEAGSAAVMEKVFAGELDGHKLITNRSIWRNFPTIRCERWTHENTVLIGDAKATAHFSIGSGTKLAMEDAIALYEAFRATGGRDVTTALSRFESQRRDEVERTQHSADVSLVWFEHVKRFWNMNPTRFAFGLMTRSRAITYDNLALRAPEFIGEADKMVAREVQAQGFKADVAQPVAPMFQPFQLRNMTLDQPRGGIADVPILGQGRPARRLAHGALRLARDRRRRADVHRDDRRLRKGTYYLRLHGHVQRRPGGGLEADRRFRARQFRGEALPAARPRRPQGRHQADVGGYRPAAARRGLAGRLGVAAALLPAQPGAARNDPRRHG